MRILIVEDNEIAMEVLRRALAQAGHDIVAATNGREALEVLRAGGIRLVVTDWEMPELDGLGLCRAIRGGELPGYVYTILLTSHDTTEEKIAGLAAGADDFIAKPFNPAELLARIQTAERVLSLETREVAIFAMAKLAESRDPETGAHLERVRSYSRIIAQYLAGQTSLAQIVTAEYIRLIYQTSPLHDIGKVGIPDSVLLKPGRLSDREFAIMKTHAQIGEQTLNAALEQFPGISFLQMARDIAATHHERFDGTGYPAGLKDEQIPLSGRIVALADVYDALTSKRVYKNEFSHDVAKAIILKEAGTQFDPIIIDAFVATESQFIAIRDRYCESRLAA
ncbi:MAG TPA: HD domain-containing phosphohydrolase [Tepidisphaeraceae bacterium]|nr:HD domain-containing phosphohydrolase [Tepidisphaeraceae bacterium]